MDLKPLDRDGGKSTLSQNSLPDPEKEGKTSAREVKGSLGLYTMECRNSPETFFFRK